MRNNIIGKHAEIIESPNKQLLGIKGIITNETKNTIVIDGKTIIKEQITININGIKTTIPAKKTSERIKVKK